MMILSQDDVMLRWKPKFPGEAITLAHPVRGTESPDLTPVATLGGYPLAATPSGVFFSDDSTNPFMAVMPSIRNVAWHRDYLHRLGVPSVQGHAVFANVGGNNATSGIVAINSKNGQSLWTYAPGGLAKEPVVVGTADVTRAPNARQKAAIEDAQLKLARRKGVQMQMPAEVKMLSSLPVIDAMHGHWLNPGVVTSGDRVFGQVGTSIVALNQESGLKQWSFDLSTNEYARSIVASVDHLFVSLDDRLIALSLRDGSLAWSQTMPRAGTLIIGGGMLFISMGPVDPKDKDGGELVAFDIQPKAAESAAGPSSPPPPPHP